MIEILVQQKKIVQRMKRRKQSLSPRTIEAAELLYAEFLNEWNRLFDNPISGK